MDNGAVGQPSNSALAADIRELQYAIWGNPARKQKGIEEKLDTLITAEEERTKKEAVRDAQLRLIMYGVGLVGVTNVMSMLSTLVRGLIP